MKLLNSKLFAVIIIALAAGISVSAQEFTSEYPTSVRDENGKVIRSGYITNEWYDNWVISVDGSLSSFAAKVSDMMATPAFDISVTKWAMPAMAFRFGVQAGQGKEGLETYSPQFMNHSPFPYSDGVLSWNYFYAHADMLWCATNTFFGYKYNRFWNVSPYIHGGFQRMFDPDAYKTNYDREAVYGAGILNTFRITDRINLNLDLRASNFSGRYHATDGGRTTALNALLGLSINIFKPGWRRAHELEKAQAAALASEAAALASLADSEKARKALADENDALRNQNDELMNEMNALKKLAADASKNYGDDELLRRIAEAGLVLYYDLGKDNIRDCEQLHINDFVNLVLAQDPKHVFYLTGSADKGTGTEAINKRLSTGRVNNVKRYLINDLKVAPEQVVIKDAIITDKHADGRLDRCVLFESK